MGQVCKRNTNQTHKIPIRPRPKVEEPQEKEDESKFPQHLKEVEIGQYFQFKFETLPSQTIQTKCAEWQSIFDEKREEFKNIPTYGQCLNNLGKIDQKKVKEKNLISDAQNQVLQQVQMDDQNKLQKNLEIIDFIAIDKENQSQSRSNIDSPPRSNHKSQHSQTNSKSQKLPEVIKKSKQEILLEQIFSEGVSQLKDENEILLYIFSCQQPIRFRELMRSGLPYQYRWLCWKVYYFFFSSKYLKIRFFNEFEYDPNLYENLLTQEYQDQHQIDKDIGRTFPKIKYFQTTEDSNHSQGQVQLYRVLKAVSINFQNVGYCQGMNFLAGFLLLTTAGNEEEVFWLLKTLCESPEFMMTGLFEVPFLTILNFKKHGFPLHNILIDLFKDKFQKEMNQLYQHFDQQNIPEYLYVTKWIMTLFVYSFPFNVIYRFWDFILSGNILTVVSLSLAIIQSYHDILLNYDLGEFSNFLNILHETPNLIVDRSNKHFLDLEKIMDLAHNKFKIGREDLEQLQTPNSGNYLSLVKELRKSNLEKFRQKNKSDILRRNNKLQSQQPNDHQPENKKN